MCKRKYPQYGNINKTEVKIALDKLKEEKMSSNNTEEALELSNINALSAEIIIINMLKII